MSLGLTLGKFAPLHRGHQLVIETALQEVDQLIVLIYDCPELDVPPLPIRANWIRRLYPSVQVLEAWDGPRETGLTPEITSKHDDYLKRRLAGLPITHFYSSELYGDHVSRALGCIDRRVDQQRVKWPISGSILRSGMNNGKSFVDPVVWRDLITHVVFLGAPSTGKTTLAEELARRFRTVWMPEYGREYWEKNQVERRLTKEQLVEIATEHIRREDELMLNANRYFLIDTDASTTLQFSYHYHDDAHEQLVRLAQQTRDRYDVFVLCDTDIPYDDTWDRSGDASRELMQRRIESDLLARKIPFHRVTGDLETRCNQICRILSKFRKYQEVARE